VPRPRRLSGDEVVAVLTRFGFAVVAQRGSHVKLQRVTGDGNHETLTVPRHRELDIGTLVAIFRQATRFIPESELRPHFYTE
jgi:predicted RNA binding protein YcfA (HicA-like mRNA interferase family)